jgi:hypothetical protein
MVLEEIVNLATLSTVGLILFAVLFFVITGIFIYIGTYVARVDNRSFISSFLAALIATLVSGAIFFFFNFTGLTSLFISVVITIFAIKVVFGTSWKKSIVTWIFSVIAEFLVIFALTAGIFASII